MYSISDLCEACKSESLVYIIIGREKAGSLGCFIILNRPIIIQTFSSAHSPMVIVGNEILQIPDENALLSVVMNCWLGISEAENGQC